MTSPAPTYIDPKVQPALSGTAVLGLLLGAVLVTSGVVKSPPTDVLRALIKNQPIPRGKWYTDAGTTNPRDLPTTGVNTGSGIGGAIVTGGITAGAGAGSATGQEVVAIATDHIGVPYVWAGETPDGWDCSGFVTWVLTQAGVKLPSNHHTTAAGFYAWTGAVTLPRADAQPGDLVCWPSHIGIALDRNTMINAPGRGLKTRIEKIWSSPAPVIRRPKAYQ